MTTVDVSIRTDVLVTHGACPSCLMPVNDQGCGPGRGWIHTLTGQYRCEGFTGNGMVFAAEAITEDEITRRINEACAETESVVAGQIRDEMYTREDVDEAADEANAVGVKEGRTQMHDELDDAISKALSLAGDNATADQLREALTTAWNSVAP